MNLCEEWKVVKSNSKYLFKINEGRGEEVTEMRIVPLTKANNDWAILNEIKPFNGTDKFMRALTRGFR